MKLEESLWFRFYKVIQKYLKKIIIFNFIILLLAVIVSFIVPKWYKATTIILPSGNSVSNMSALNLIGDLGGLASGFLGGVSSDVNRYLAILKSRNLREKVIKKYNLMEEYGSEDMEEALKSFDDNIEVEVGDEMQIEISFLDKKQDVVADITNYIVHCLDSININLSIKEARNNKKFIQSRVNIVIDSLMLLQQELKNFMEKNGVLDIENQIIVGLQNIGEIKSQLMQKQIEIDVAQKQVSPNSALMKKLRTELEAIDKYYKKFFTDSTSEGKIVPPLNKIPYLYLKFAWLRKQIDYYEKLLEFLGPQYEQAKIQEAKTIPTLQILDYAVRPDEKHLPKRWLIVLIALLISSSLSLYYVYWREYVYKKFHE